MKRRIIYIMLFTLGMTTLMGCNSSSKDKDQQTSADANIEITTTPTPNAKASTPTTEPATKTAGISEEEALNIVSQYVLETVENAKNLQLGYSYEDIQTLNEVNDTCHVFRVSSETQEASTSIGFYAVSLDGSKLYVMDQVSGVYVNAEDLNTASNGGGQTNDNTATTHVLSSLGFQLLDEVTDLDGIKISFPQFTNEKDPATADLINGIIQDDIKAYLSTLGLPSDGDSKSTIEMTYELNGYDKKVLSIIYKGLFNNKEAAYPTNAYHTLNIYVGDDVHSVPLTEAFIVDNKLLDMIKNGMYSPYSKDLNLEESIDNFREFIESNWEDSDLYDYLNANPNYYFTDYGVIISIEIPHVIGDHLEMAIPYEAIESNMNKESAVWKNYMFINQG